MHRNLYSRFVMHNDDYFYSVEPSTPSCCSCTNWVATRIFNRDAFLCPSDGLGACKAADKNDLTPPSECCQSWQPWQSSLAAIAATT
ncbi:MAG: hypothetical protein AB7U30_09185 [Sulfuricellaceae bacterium]